MDIFLFDSENAIDPEFLQNQGLDVSRIVYVQAKSVEFVLGTIDRLLAHLTHPALFIWDSVAMTPVEKIVEGEINPDKDMGTKARVLAQGMSKLAIP